MKSGKIGEWLEGEMLPKLESHYVVNEIIMKLRHPLCLPPYQPNLNPIKSVWGRLRVK